MVWVLGWSLFALRLVWFTCSLLIVVGLNCFVCYMDFVLVYCYLLFIRFSVLVVIVGLWCYSCVGFVVGRYLAGLGCMILLIVSIYVVCFVFGCGGVAYRLYILGIFCLVVWCWLYVWCLQLIIGYLWFVTSFILLFICCAWWLFVMV